MSPPAAPFVLEVLKDTVVHPSSACTSQKNSETHLSAHDVLTAATATVRAWGWRGARVEPDLLEEALAATAADLPFLAGRLHLRGMHLGSAAIEHPAPSSGGSSSGGGSSSRASSSSGSGSKGGIRLTVVEATEVSVACMGPDAWVSGGRDMTIQDPAAPWYVPRLDLSLRALTAGAPVMAVQLSLLADGCILAISLMHCVCDGMRWPQLTAHLAARYRRAAAQRRLGGTGVLLPDNAAELLRPCDRRLLSSEAMAGQLLGEGAEWAPPATLPRPRLTLAGCWNLGRLLLSDARQHMELAMLHVPAEQVAALKALAADGNSAVTTGDAIQAAAGLLAHLAQGLPPLPVAPHAQVCLVQLPVPQAYFGNAVHMLRVKLPAGTAQPAAGDHAGALRTLAGAIRSATAAFRSSPADQLAAIADTERLVAAPAFKMLAWLADKRMPLLTCTTNYVPVQQGINLGLGCEPAYCQGLTLPRARNMVLIRPAVAPYSEGLFLQLCLSAQQAARLRGPEGGALLAALLPAARWVGG